jgi:hypothetical protein
MRRKIFGMICVPLDRNQKARLLFRARALMRANEPGRHYGAITAKAYAILRALLMEFHNAGSGRCFPSYKRIQEAVGCSKATVAAALRALEAVGLLGVCNRLVRVRWRDEPSRCWRLKVVRTSNCYVFASPAMAGPPAESSKFNFQEETRNQVSFLPLLAACGRLQGAIRGGASARPARSGRPPEAM